MVRIGDINPTGFAVKEKKLQKIMFGTRLVWQRTTNDLIWNGVMIDYGNPSTISNQVSVQPLVANGLPTKYYVSEQLLDVGSIAWKDYSEGIKHTFTEGSFGMKTLYLYLKGLVNGIESVLQYNDQHYATASIDYIEDPLKVTIVNLQIPLSSLGIESSDGLEVEFPRWKFDKKFVLSPQVDDGLNYYASNVFNYAWGRSFGTSEAGTGILGYEDSGFKSFAEGFKEQIGPYIGHSDGTGLIRPFRSGIAFNALQSATVQAITSEADIASRLKKYADIPATASGVDLSSNDPDWSDGEKIRELDSGDFRSAAINAFQSTTVSTYLPYPAYTTLADLGFGISNHGATTEDLESMIPVSAFGYCITGSSGTYDTGGAILTWDIEGNWLHSIIVPGGKIATLQKFMDYPCFYFFSAANDFGTEGARDVHSLAMLFPPMDSKGKLPAEWMYSDLDPIFKARMFPSNTPVSEWNENIDTAHQHGYWLIQSSHGRSDGVTAAVYKAFIDYIYENYGLAGNDSVWVASQEEVYEYLFASKASSLTVSDDGKNLIIEIKARELPLFYYNELSILIKNVPSATVSTDQVVDGSGSLYTLSAAKAGDDNVLINFGWNPREPQRAAKWLANYFAAQSSSDIQRAVICEGYFNNILERLKPGKDRLRLEAIYTGGDLPSDLGSIRLSPASLTFSRDIQVIMNIEGSTTPHGYMLSEDPLFTGETWLTWPGTQGGGLVDFTLSEGYSEKTVYCKIHFYGEESSVRYSRISYAEQPEELVTRLSLGYGRVATGTTMAFEGGINKLQILGSEGTGYGANLPGPLPLYNNIGFLAGYLHSTHQPTSMSDTQQGEWGAVPDTKGVYADTDFKFRLGWNGGYSPRYGTLTFSSIPEGTYDVRIYDSTATAASVTSNNSSVTTSQGTYPIDDPTHSPYNSSVTWAVFKNVEVGFDGDLSLLINIAASGNPKVGVNIVELVKHL